jgi:hypothetical protein
MYNITITRTTRTFIVNTSGRRGYPGQGVASGGTTGQILHKKSNAPYDTEWKDKNSIDGSLSLLYAIAFGL